jgi:signal transduction histidine kinase
MIRHWDPGVCVRVNPVEMESCLVNLLVNAYEALGEERGEVVVRTSLLPYPTQNYDGVVELVVEDTGPGIPRGVTDEVFTPFFSRKAGGVGLGLSIAFESAKRNGAQMQIESDGQTGTRVTMRLPFLRESGSDLATGKEA